MQQQGKTVVSREERLRKEAAREERQLRLQMEKQQLQQQQAPPTTTTVNVEPPQKNVDRPVLKFGIKTKGKRRK